MNGKLISTFIVLGLWAAAVSCSAAAELQASEYIDATDINRGQQRYRMFLRDFIEKHGSEYAEHTARVLRELGLILKKIIASGDNSKAIVTMDKFGVVAQLEQSRLTGKGLLSYLDAINNMIVDPKTHCDIKQDLDLFFGFIKMYFGDDLNGFAHGRVTHDRKLYAFLYHYGKIIVSHWMGEAAEVSDDQSWISECLEEVIAHNLPSGYAETKLIGEAQNTTGRDLLARMSSGDKSEVERAPQRLRRYCSAFSSAYGFEMEIYAWARLLLPEKVAHFPKSKDLPKLAEYWRVCLPFMNREKFQALIS